MDQAIAPEAPVITVQVVHIDGPTKGQVNEFQKDTITIGRDPGNDVVMPADLLIISRHHAELKREGNRFLLLSTGKNQCLMHNHPVSQSYLKQGDIICLAEGGPKLSFLFNMKAPTRGSQAAPRPRAITGVSPPPPAPPSPRTSSSIASRAATTSGAGPFTLQYGVQIKSLNKAKISLGRAKDNDFALSHPAVSEHHLEIHHQSSNYVIHDKTGSGQTWINQRPVRGPETLSENDVLTLGHGGPSLRFLGTGRFMEVLEEEEPAEENVLTELADSPVATHSAFSALPKSKKSFIKNIFKR